MTACPLVVSMKNFLSVGKDRQIVVFPNNAIAGNCCDGRYSCSLNTHCSLDVRVWIVIDQIEILVRERKQVVDVGIDHHLRQRPWVSCQLFSCLIHMVQLQINITKRVHKLTRLQSNNLSHHHG